ncbi:MAG: DNA internalization-related competence protein ComEC/Rec2 [Clostridiales bacterium]|nr:DNA internalization-related competence protein ComEC/Rec2 [Clostridiales bacterium]
MTGGGERTMRVLATIGFSFSAGVFLAALLPWNGWQLYAAGGVLLLALAWLFAARKQKYFRRGLLILLPLAVSLAYFAGYDHLVRQPIENRCGAASDFAATVCDWPQATERGAKITVELEGYHRARAVLYGEAELLAARPGDTVTGTAQWQSAVHFNSDDVTHFNARGVYALLYGREDVRLSAGDGDALRWLPQRAGKAFREKVAAIWDDARVSGFLTAELTGDKSAMDDGDYLAMQETGLAHLFAVSGLHCAFLVTLLALLISRRQRLLCAVTIPLLLFYMVMVGMSPSVVRACIMQIFLLIAPLFRRGSDPLTSLAAALLVILLCNPFAAASVSLQLSFSATLGMVLLSPRLYKLLTGWYKGKCRPLRTALCFVAANLSATLSAVVFTAPLTAWYFRIFVLVAPLSSLLAVPAAGWSFMAAFVTVLLGFVWLPLASLLGWISWALVRYILWIANGMMSWRYHAVYFTNPYLVYWLLFLYAAFIGCAATPDGKRKYLLASALSVLTLTAAIWVNRQDYQYGVLTALTLDVGQGESVILTSGGETALVDCGSSNSYKDPGGLAADTLHSMGVRELSAVVVTHYHADHTNGLYEVLRRIPVQTIYLPDIEDEYGVRERLVSLAEEKGAQVTYVTKETADTLGDTVLTIYPPVQSGGDLNELGLTALASAGDFDLLITGDMSGSTEKKLVETYALPDIEVLVVSHHGSRYSSNIRFLKSVTPEAAVISVGDNNYGHPSEETLQRLLAVGADIWRTDQQGTIRITVNGG